MRRSTKPFWIFPVIVALVVLVLAFLNGCGRDQPESRSESPETAEPESRLRTAQPVAPPADTVTTGVDTVNVPWTDSTTKGDTLILEHSNIRSIVTRLAITVSEVIPIRTDTIVTARFAGVPYGAFALKQLATWPAGLSLTNYPVSPSSIVSDIRALRAKRGRAVLMLTGGPHNVHTGGPFMTKRADGWWYFDSNKWRAHMDKYNTPAIKAELSAAVADGTVLLSSVMDEPETTGGGDGNGWGKPGFMNKYIVDSLGAYHKKVLPGVPVSVNHGPNGYYQWHPTQRYNSFDAVLVQYSAWVTAGNAASFRDKVLTQAALDKLTPAFSMNLINGGLADRDGVWDCGGEGKGQDPPQCQITAAQLEQWAKVLGRAGCAMLMWRYDPVYFSTPAKKTAMTNASNYLASLPPKSCRRTG